MKKLFLLAIAGLFVTPAYADFTGKDASAATITFKNPNVCTSVACVPIFQMTDGAGAAFGVTGSPLFISFGTGVTLPAYASTPTFNLGTLNGAATAAKQPAIGVAGTPSADVISVQGVAGGTPQPISAASSSVSPGAYQAGAFVDGASVTEGLTTDAAATAGSTGTFSAKFRLMTTQLNTLHTDLGTLNTTAGNPLAAGTNLIGKVGIDQTTPGTTNGVQDAATSATGSAAPSKAAYQGANVGGNLTGSIKCGSSVVYDASTSGSTQLVALSGSTSVYVCGYTIVAGGTVNVNLSTGTGTACATGTAKLTPAYQLTAQAGVADGTNEYRGLKGAASSELCINTSAAVAVQAIVYYTQF